MQKRAAMYARVSTRNDHSIDHSQVIFEYYLPRDVHMARAGIVKQGRKK